ncbi:MAGE family-domain-containing protein [Mucor mucedo]|uniref:MAGE family-domain-containing protein n=1 Tax=Mucor mucedo TaxID=29922 RepID=UPI00221F0842|nr:MAGE family-domain-containing protein [Mucor mucedo]KAI7895740.1 MAGE family-domain-containing protein [Mucor mucedo]
MSSQARPQKRARLDNDADFSQLQEEHWDDEALQRKVKDVIRYALACEYKRKVVKREDITKIISQGGNKKVSFNNVMDLVRIKLNQVFGMDLVELPKLREKLNQSQTQLKNTQSTQAAESSTQAQSSTQAAAAARSGTSGTFILRYNMKESYRTGEVLNQSPEEYQQTGILYVILGLIFLNSQSMTSPDLYSHLDRLKISKSNSASEDRDKLLELFIKNQHLKKTKRPDTSGDDTEFDYTWGARAKLELSPENMVQFLLQFYDGSSTQKKELQDRMYKQGGYQVATRATSEGPN